MIEVTMPSLADSMEAGTILSWLKKEGEYVTKGEDLVEIETDKATMTYESIGEGALTIVVSEGTTVPVGTVIARVDDLVKTSEVAEIASSAAERTSERVAQAAATSSTSDTSSAEGASRVLATPQARRLAKKHGIDLQSIKGTGAQGRVLRTDVAALAGIARDSAKPAVKRTVSSPSAVGRLETVDRTQELTRQQQVVARRMTEAKANIPEFQVQAEVSADAVMALRAQLKTVGAEFIPSINDFVVKACGLALREHPRANSSYRDGHFVFHGRVNIGIAVAAEDALIVPTINDADTRSLNSIAADARLLAERVRSGSITPAELSGATFTVSNLGMYGMSAITPIINPPQAAILGIGAARAVPRIVDGQLVEEQKMTLTLTCDHRILYGAHAALFLARVTQLLEQPISLVL